MKKRGKNIVKDIVNKALVMKQKFQGLSVGSMPLHHTSIDTCTNLRFFFFFKDVCTFLSGSAVIVVVKTHLDYVSQIIKTGL